MWGTILSGIWTCQHQFPVCHFEHFPPHWMPEPVQNFWMNSHYWAVLLFADGYLRYLFQFSQLPFQVGLFKESLLFLKHLIKCSDLQTKAWNGLCCVITLQVFFFNFSRSPTNPSAGFVSTLWKQYVTNVSRLHNGVLAAAWVSDDADFFQTLCRTGGTEAKTVRFPLGNSTSLAGLFPKTAL